jgi:glycopeptide antibiotics resistance protein
VEIESMENYYRLLRKHWLNLLILSYIFFVVYSTIVPFNFITGFDIFIQRFSRIDWIPLQRNQGVIARSDVVANILFFIPLGILLALRKILKFYQNFTIIDWFQIFITGFTVSLLVEFLQLFTFDRHTSITDLITNSLGNLLGALLMLVIYLKFHVEIKNLLYYIFVRKPEMAISGFFLIFIFISYSIPFTFQPAFRSIRWSFYVLLDSSIRIRTLLLYLPFNIMIFGSFSYLLLIGVFRYFSQLFDSWKIYLLLLSLLGLPLILETYQLLIPIRNHAFTDIIAAEIGIITGMLFFYIQLRTNFRDQVHGNISHTDFQNAHAGFFQFLALVYLFYIFFYISFTKPLFASANNFGILFQPGIEYNFSVLKLKRLNLLIHFAKEVFAFLPAGFILSLLRDELQNWWKTGGFIAIILAIFIIGIIICSPFQSSFFFSLLSITATLLGIYLGYISYEIYKYLMNSI